MISTQTALPYQMDHQPDPTEPGTVYLLHFDTPISHARHYIGWAKNLDRRLAHHRAGTGARLTAAAAKLGIPFSVARTWVGDRNFERQLKNQKQGPKLCPICNPKKQRKP